MEKIIHISRFLSETVVLLIFSHESEEKSQFKWIQMNSNEFKFFSSSPLQIRRTVLILKFIRCRANNLIRKRNSLHFFLPRMKWFSISNPKSKSFHSFNFKKTIKCLWNGFFLNYHHGPFSDNSYNAEIFTESISTSLFRHETKWNQNFFKSHIGCSV